MNLLTGLKKSFGTLLDLVYPGSCVLCGESHLETDYGLCRDCAGKISFLRMPLCERRSNEECSFDRLIAAGIYDGLLKECIHAFKFGGKEDLGEWFSRFMADFIAANNVDLSGYDLIVPVPMHLTKRKERGFNQAELLADALSAIINIRCGKNILKRKIPGSVQSSLDRKRRFANVKGAFELADSGEVKDRNIILVDDIYTTGATSGECARILKEGEAREVAVFVIARGVKAGQ